MNSRKKLLTVVLVLLVVLFGGTSAYLAIRLSTSTPVAPTAPVSEPKASTAEDSCTAKGGECTTAVVCASKGGTNIKATDCSQGTSCCSVPWAVCNVQNFEVPCIPRPGCLDEDPKCAPPEGNPEDYCPYLACNVRKNAYLDDPRNLPGKYYVEKIIPAGSEVYRGQTFVYLIPFKNLGSTTVQSAVITDVLDSKITYVDADDGCSYTSGTRTVTCDIDPMVAGKNGAKAIRVKVNSSATVEDLLNTAKITSTGGSVSLCLNKLTVKPAKKPVVSCISKKCFDTAGVASTTFTKGQQIKYVFDVMNSGNATSTGYTLADKLTGEGRELLTFVSGTGCTYDDVTDQVNCDAKLEPGERKTLSFIASISNTAPDNKTIKNTGIVTGPNVAGSIGVAICSTESAVRNPIINAVKKAYKDNTNNTAGNYTLTEEINTVSRNQVFVYTINVQNSGTGDAVGVTITDRLEGDGQENLYYVDGEAGCTMNDSTRTVTCKTDVEAGSSKNVSFRVKVNDTVTNDDSIKNTARVVLGDQSITVTKLLLISSEVGCNQVCNSNSECSDGLWCDTTANKCRKQACTAETSCVCPAVVTPTATPIVVRPTVVVTAAPTVAPTEVLTPTEVAVKTPTPTKVVAVKTPTPAPEVLPETGILDIPGIAVFGGGLLLAVVGILLAL